VLSNLWHDFNAAPRWRYAEQPPRDLLRIARADSASGNDTELERAEWLWRRRPRLVVGESLHGYAIVVSVAIALFFVPTVGLFLSWLWNLGAFFIIMIDVTRHVRWRRDYEQSIERLIRRTHHR
jgi:hypothetical protein